MVSSDLVQHNFQHRLKSIPPLGIGLSVDVYSPDLFELVSRLKEQEYTPGYLEVFKATATALRSVRQAVQNIPLGYHGEGLWITQPDIQASSIFQQDVDEAVTQLNCLQSLWLNHECATKQMAGYSFGTYLSPLYTRLSAEVVAENIAAIQQAMDLHGRRADGTSPLFLLEMPPLTYFFAGTIPISQFFRLVTALAPCGLALDIGHLWTVYRYTAACRRMSLEQFVGEFLDEFPLERVVEIHIAGLAYHESIDAPKRGEGLPEWIDAHAAPIPSILFTMLEQVLAHPNLLSLRAVALEVDTKPVEMIVEEYAEAVRRFSHLIRPRMARETDIEQSMEPTAHPAPAHGSIRRSDREQLQDDYARYAQIISGQAPIAGPEWQETVADATGVTRYQTMYVPHEILHWGGDLAEMFPQTCRILTERGIRLSEFVPFWFRSPRPLTRSYDFFLLKIERFLEFVTERAPEARVCVQGECDILRQAYTQASEVVEPVMEMERTQ
jgi:uncharacterized protein (UPF0276 family)